MGADPGKWHHQPPKKTTNNNKQTKTADKGETSFMLVICKLWKTWEQTGVHEPSRPLIRWKVNKELLHRRVSKTCIRKVCWNLDRKCNGHTMAILHFLSKYSHAELQGSENKKKREREKKVTFGPKPEQWQASSFNLCFGCALWLMAYWLQRVPTSTSAFHLSCSLPVLILFHTVRQRMHNRNNASCASVRWRFVKINC